MSYVAGNRKPSRLRFLPSPANRPGSAEDRVARRYAAVPTAGLTAWARWAICCLVKPSGKRTLSTVRAGAGVVGGGGDASRWFRTTAEAPQAHAPTTTHTTTRATTRRR